MIKVVNYSTVDCGSPSPPADGSITSLTGTIEGSRVTFRCDDGSLEMYAECQPDGNWEPNPVQFDCSPATASSTTSSSMCSLCNFVHRVSCREWCFPH